MRYSEQEHRMLARAEFLCSHKETLKLFVGQIRDATPNLLCPLLRHPDDVLEYRWCHGSLQLNYFRKLMLHCQANSATNCESNEVESPRSKQNLPTEDRRENPGDKFLAECGSSICSCDFGK